MESDGLRYRRANALAFLPSMARDIPQTGAREMMLRERQMEEWQGETILDINDFKTYGNDIE